MTRLVKLIHAQQGCKCLLRTSWAIAKFTIKGLSPAYAGSLRTNKCSLLTTINTTKIPSTVNYAGCIEKPQIPETNCKISIQNIMGTKQTVTVYKEIGNIQKSLMCSPHVIYRFRIHPTVTSCFHPSPHVKLSPYTCTS
jgi:hypothetical protein